MAASAEVQTLINQASQDLQQSQTDLKAGNFAAYGTDIANLQTTMQQLEQASGVGTPGSATRVDDHDNDDHDEPEQHCAGYVARRRRRVRSPLALACKNTEEVPAVTDQHREVSVVFW